MTGPTGMGVSGATGPIGASGATGAAGTTGATGPVAGTTGQVIYNNGGVAAGATLSGGLSIQSGTFVPSDIIKLVVSNKGETAIPGANYVETTVLRACTVIAAYWECSPISTGSSTSQAMLYARRSGTRSNLLSADASLAAVSTVTGYFTDVTSTLIPPLTLTTGDTLGVNLNAVGTGSSGHIFTVIVRYS
jgi:hypothetical protein